MFFKVFLKSFIIKYRVFEACLVGPLSCREWSMLGQGSFSLGLFHRFVHVTVSVFAHKSPEHVCYVLSTDGTSCIVTTVDPLVLLKCSPLICSKLMLLRSTRGMRNPFSEGVLELDCMMLSLAEFGPRLLMARFVCVVVEDAFFLGLLELPVNILFVWVLLSWSS